MQELCGQSPVALRDASLLKSDKKIVLTRFLDSYGDRWQIIDLEHKDPTTNLATEEALLKLVGRGQIPQTVRFWRNSNCVVIGRFQRASWETNLAACRKFGTTIHTRFTGGGAVYQDLGNLNWTICCKRDSPLVPRDVPQLFEKFSASVVHGIRALGLNAEYEPRGTYVHVNQKKVIGMASAIKYMGVLLHGTLLVSTNLQILENVLQAPTGPMQGSSGKTDPKRVQSKKQEVTTLEKELGRKVTIIEVKAQLCSSFQLHLQG